jgi:hypothetical protein
MFLLGIQKYFINTVSLVYNFWTSNLINREMYFTITRYEKRMYDKKIMCDEKIL